MSKLTKEMAVGNRKQASQPSAYIDKNEELNAIEVFSDPIVSSVRIWTMHLKTMRLPVPVYSILNNAVRSDEFAALQAALPLIRGINSFCCFPQLREQLDAAGMAQALSKHPMAGWSRDKCLYRGGTTLITSTFHHVLQIFN